MSVLQGSPRLTKGAIITIDPHNPLASIIVFQYNPAEIVRSLTLATGASAPVDTLRLTGPPRETISATITIHAVDQLDQPNPVTARFGIYPELSALEMLMYPKSAQVIASAALAALGTLEVVPPSAPLTLFVWGSKRIAPVALEQLEITEQYHDPNLNPIIATASLRMRVLTYNDFLPREPGYAAFLAYQVVKEAMAMLASASDLASAAAGGARVR
jgi:hypothetical protein